MPTLPSYFARHEADYFCIERSGELVRASTGVRVITSPDRQECSWRSRTSTRGRSSISWPKNRNVRVPGKKVVSMKTHLPKGTSYGTGLGWLKAWLIGDW